MEIHIVKDYHKNLAKYFNKKPLYLDEPTQKKPNIRKLAEQPWQQTKAKMWDNALAILNAYEFVEAKMKAFKLKEVQDDYSFILNNIPDNRPERNILDTWSTFFREKKHLLLKGNEEWPVYKILLQLAIEHAENSPVTKSVENYLKNKNAAFTWIMPLLRPGQLPVNFCLFTIDSFFENNTGIFNPDLSISKDSNHILVSTENNEIIIADLRIKEIVSRKIYSNRIIKYAFLKSDYFIIADCEGKFKIGNVNNPEDLKHFAFIDEQDFNLISFSSDSNYAFVKKNDQDLTDLFCNENYDIDIWDLSENRKISSLHGHTGTTNIMLQVSDEYLITASGSKAIGGYMGIHGFEKITLPRNIKLRKHAIIVWNLNLLDEIRVLSDHKNCITSLAYADFDKLVSLSLDHTLKFWQWTNIEKPCFSSIDTPDITSITLSDNYTFFVTGLKDGTITLYDIIDKCYSQIGTHQESINQIKVSNDNKYIISVSDTKIKIWDIEKAVSAMKRGEIPIKNTKETNVSQSYYADLRLFIPGNEFSSQRNQTVEDSATSWQFESGKNLINNDLIIRLKCFDTQVGKEFTEVLKNLKQHSGIMLNVNDSQVFKFGMYTIFNFTPSVNIGVKNLFIYVIGDKVSIYNYLDNTNFTIRAPEKITTIAYFEDNLIFGIINGDIAIVNLDNLDKINKVVVLRSHLGTITDMKVDKSLKLLISASIDGTIKVWDLTTMSLKFDLVSHTDIIFSIEITADHNLLSGGADNSIVYWDLKNGHKINEFIGHKSSVLFLSVHPNGKYFFSASKDGEIRKWHFNSINTQYLFAKMSNPVIKMLIASDGSKLIAFGNEQIKVFDLNSSHELFSLQPSSDYSPNESENRVFPDIGRRSFSFSGIDEAFNPDSEHQNKRKVGSVIQHLYLNAFITSNQQYLVALLSSDIIELRNLITGNLEAKLFSEKSISNCCLLSDNQILIAKGSDDILKYCTVYSNSLFERSIKFYTEQVKNEPTTNIKELSSKGNTNLNSNGLILDTLIQFISEKPLKYIYNSQYENMVQSINASYNSPDTNSDLFNSSLRLINPDLLLNVHASVKTQLNNNGKILRYSFINKINDYKLLLLKCLQCNHNDLAGTTYFVIKELIALNKIAKNQLWAQDKSGNIFYMGHELVEIIENWLEGYGIILENNQWVSGPTLGAIECQFSFWQTGQMIRINNGPYTGLFQFQNYLVIPGIKILLMILEKENIENNTNEKFNEKVESKQNNYEHIFKLKFDEAEMAFNEGNWEEAYNQYLKLVQQGKFDINYLRYNMAICLLNVLTTNNPEIINNINILIKLIQDKGAIEKAQDIADKLKDRLDTIRQEEIEKKKAEKPWWKKFF